MLQFVVDGPIEVPLYKRLLAPDVIRNQFWPLHHSAAQACGCYIFAVPRKRGALGFLPIYVGKSARPFEQECFTSEKLTKLNRFLQDHRAERVMLVLVKHPRTRGRINQRAIEQLETALIKLAVSINPELVNKRGVRPEDWGIRGVVRGGRGRASGSAVFLKNLLGLSDPDNSESLADAEEATSSETSALGAETIALGDMVLPVPEVVGEATTE